MRAGRTKGGERWNGRAFLRLAAKKPDIALGRPGQKEAASGFIEKGNAGKCERGCRPGEAKTCGTAGRNGSSGESREVRGRPVSGSRARGRDGGRTRPVGKKAGARKVSCCEKRSRFVFGRPGAMGTGGRRDGGRDACGAFGGIVSPVASVRSTGRSEKGSSALPEWGPLYSKKRDRSGRGRSRKRRPHREYVVPSAGRMHVRASGPRPAVRSTARTPVGSRQKRIKAGDRMPTFESRHPVSGFLSFGSESRFRKPAFSGARISRRTPPKRRVRSKYPESRTAARPTEPSRPLPRPFSCPAEPWRWGCRSTACLP